MMNQSLNYVGRERGRIYNYFIFSQIQIFFLFQYLFSYIASLERVSQRKNLSFEIWALEYLTASQHTWAIIEGLPQNEFSLQNNPLLTVNTATVWYIVLSTTNHTPQNTPYYVHYHKN